MAALPPSVADALRDPAATPPEFVVRFQQTTGAVMAKGIEDTAMYRDVRLLALNEVGGDPDRFGIAVDEFHRTNELRLGVVAARAPRRDHARHEAQRRRAGAHRRRSPRWATQWLEVVEWWRARCAEHATGHGAPDADEQLFVLQTLVGAWPLSRARLDGYLVKAFREAKRHTAWVDPDEKWERAVLDVVAQAMADPRFNEVFVPFLVDVRASRRSHLARCARAALHRRPACPTSTRATSCGTTSLVDPDNRRPVDWSLRQLLLDHQLRGAQVDRFTAKLFTLRVLLALRARTSGFAELGYTPLDGSA